MTEETFVKMALSSEDAYSRAAAKIRHAGRTPGRGPSRIAYPIVLVVRHLTDEAEQHKLEAMIRSVDSGAKQVIPRGTFSR